MLKKAFVFVLTLFCVSLTMLCAENSATAATATITTKGLNVHSAPSAGSGIIGVLNQNDTEHVLQVRGDWMQIRSNGKTGWVVSKYLTVTQAAPVVKPAPAHSSMTRIWPAVQRFFSKFLQGAGRVFRAIGHVLAVIGRFSLHYILPVLGGDCRCCNNRHNHSLPYTVVGWRGAGTAAPPAGRSAPTGRTGAAGTSAPAG
jgi:hypothetical protein